MVFSILGGEPTGKAGRCGQKKAPAGAGARDVGRAWRSGRLFLEVAGDGGTEAVGAQVLAQRRVDRIGREAVSYTPLDVYKRQVLARAWQAAEAGHELPWPAALFHRAGRSVLPRPVSYTHLDVYKRQIQHNPNAADGPEGFRKFVAFLRDKYPQSKSEIKRVFTDGDYVILHVHACLLYTSRCV